MYTPVNPSSTYYIKVRFKGIKIIHYENTPIQIYIEIFTKFLDKKSVNFFHISAQNIDCGYSLEPPHRGTLVFLYKSGV